MKIFEKRNYIIVGIVFLCFFVLSIAEYRGMYGEYREAWRVEFSDPLGKNMDFKVQNDTSQTTFRYTVYVEKKPIADRELTLAKNETKIVSSKDLFLDSSELQGKIRIRVKDELGGEREIFKIFSE